MDGFVAWSENGGLAMSYYDATDLPIGRLAQQYTLADRFFHSGRQWLKDVCYLSSGANR